MTKKLFLLTVLTLITGTFTFKANAADDSCATLISKFFLSGQKAQQYKWVNRSLSDVQIEKIQESLKGQGIELKAGSTIHVLTINDLGKGPINGIFPQVLKENTAYENKLLALSSVNQEPKATFQFRAVMSNKEIFDYNIYQGTKLPTSVLNGAAEFLNASSKLPFAYGVELKKVEISIVHPYFQVGVNVDGKPTAHLDLINAVEYEEAIEVLKSLPRGVEVILKAITPNGFYYETVLKL